MSKRSQVVAASALTVVSVFLVGASFVPLDAASVGVASGFDYTKILLWAGAILLVISALLYIRASAE